MDNEFIVTGHDQTQQSDQMLMMATPKVYKLKRFFNEYIDSMISIKKSNFTEPYLVSAYGYCHNIRVNKKIIFVVLRREMETIQLIVFKNDNSIAYDQLKDLNNEATISIIGEIVSAEVKSCTVTNYEIKIHTISVINSSKILPFSLDDANETFQSDSVQDEISDTTSNNLKDKMRCNIGRQMRLDNRWLDLRIPINQHIFRLRSALEASLREVLINNEFMEIHTPKIIPAVSESGSDVFDISYFDKTAYLAQSPQLYKQMMINSGFNKVFEIGPIFRAENANTYRHLCEFIGLDIEFIIDTDQTHIDIIKFIWSILYDAYSLFEENNDIKYVLEKTNTKALIFPELPVLIDYNEGCELLRNEGILQDPMDDIGSTNEKKLGDIIKRKFETDVYVLVGFPNHVRPFYTMHEDKDYSRSFDFMMRGNEILSGAQRVHNPQELRKAILNKGINLDGTSGLEDYLASFEMGSFPHGGCGIGLERLLMLILGLSNVRTTSLFPRDPKRITP